MDNSTYDIAYHYCVSHIAAATIPASRLSTILERMHQGRSLTDHSLSYLQRQNLHGLYRLACGEINYEDYIATLDPAVVARQQVSKAEHDANEALRLIRETDYLAHKATRVARRAAPEVDREAQRKLHRKTEREASEAVLRAQRERQAQRAAQRERNREAAAAAYQARASDPDFIDPTAHDIACHYHLNHLPSAVIPPLSDVLDAIFRGHSLSKDDLEYLQREAPANLYQLAIGQITFDSYVAVAEAFEAAELARKARAEAAEAARISRESDPDYIAMVQAQALFEKYGIAWDDQSALPQLKNILRNIDSGHRLAEEDFVWLSTAAKRWFTEKLREAYHRIEAEFYAAEYRREHDPWNAVNASGHYRKCNQPRTALDLLDGLAINRLKHPKMQSAVITTRGGVMRDLGRRAEALQLGEQAHELQPQNFRPCTLLGAVHMELGNFDRGREWYAKAEERGASEKNIDTELQRIFQRADKMHREDMKAFLLAVDQNRYRWVNDKRYQGAAVTHKS